MTFCIYNTMTRSKEAFSPIDGKTVRYDKEVQEAIKYLAQQNLYDSVLKVSN